MSETPPNNPDDMEEFFQTPEFQAQLAHADLDILLSKWMEFHPDVTGEDIDTALERFRQAVTKRDAQSPSEGEHP